MTEKPTFSGYEGKAHWDVFFKGNHVEVIAPDEQSAIVTAAKHWGKRWQDYTFYAYCSVHLIGR